MGYLRLKKLIFYTQMNINEYAEFNPILTMALFQNNSKRFDAIPFNALLNISTEIYNDTITVLLFDTRQALVISSDVYNNGFLANLQNVISKLDYNFDYKTLEYRIEVFNTKSDYIYHFDFLNVSKRIDIFTIETLSLVNRCNLTSSQSKFITHDTSNVEYLINNHFNYVNDFFNTINNTLIIPINGIDISQNFSNLENLLVNAKNINFKVDGTIINNYFSPINSKFIKAFNANFMYKHHFGKVRKFADTWLDTFENFQNNVFQQIIII